MLETIMNHRSIRKYKPQPLPDDMLDEILTAGFRASTTGNMQLYSIVVTKEQALKDQLWACHFKQDMVKQAPVVLTFCADINRFGLWCQSNKAVPGYDNFLWFLNAAIDALLAAQNIAIAAEAKGLGICYLGTTTYMAGPIIDLLNCPKGVVPVTTVVMGYPDDWAQLSDRLPAQGIVHEERYEDYTPDGIQAIYAHKESLEQTKNLIEENKTDTLAQIFTDKRYVKKDNVLFSNKYLEVLHMQGFMNQDQ